MCPSLTAVDHWDRCGPGPALAARTIICRGLQRDCRRPQRIRLYVHRSTLRQSADGVNFAPVPRRPGAPPVLHLIPEIPAGATNNSVSEGFYRDLWYSRRVCWKYMSLTASPRRRKKISIHTAPSTVFTFTGAAFQIPTLQRLPIHELFPPNTQSSRFRRSRFHRRFAAARAAQYFGFHFFMAGCHRPA